MTDATVGESGLHVADEQFVHEWMTNGYNVVEAYKAAHPKVSNSTASSQGNKKLKDPTIAAYVSGVLKSHLEKYNVTEESIVEELANIAFLDVANLMDKDGSLITDVRLLPERVRRCVSAVEENIEGKIKIKLCSKEKALEMLAKYKKLLTDKHEISGGDDLAQSILNARKRVIKETKTITEVEEMLE